MRAESTPQHNQCGAPSRLRIQICFDAKLPTALPLGYGEHPHRGWICEAYLRYEKSSVERIVNVAHANAARHRGYYVNNIRRTIEWFIKTLKLTTLVLLSTHLRLLLR